MRGETAKFIEPIMDETRFAFAVEFPEANGKHIVIFFSSTLC